MKKLLIMFIPFIFISCASFNPGPIDYRSALTSPESKSGDSVYVFTKQYSVKEAKLIFDTNFRYVDFEPIYVSIFNRSSNKIFIAPQNFFGYTELEKVYDDTKSAPFSFFLVWSIPWVINVAAGWPIYYGIVWPIFGGIAMGKSSSANSNREEFYNSVTLKETELSYGQEVYGIVFLQKTKEDSIHITLRTDSSLIDFPFENKSDMFVK